MRMRGGPAALERLSFRRRCLNHSTPVQDMMRRFSASATRQSASWVMARAAVQGRAPNGSAQRVAARSAAKTSSRARPSHGEAAWHRTSMSAAGEAEQAQLVAEHVQLRGEVEKGPRRQPARQATLAREHRARPRRRRGARRQEQRTATGATPCRVQHAARGRGGGGRAGVYDQHCFSAWQAEARRAWIGQARRAAHPRLPQHRHHLDCAFEIERHVADASQRGVHRGGGVGDDQPDRSMPAAEGGRAPRPLRRVLRHAAAVASALAVQHKRHRAGWRIAHREHLPMGKEGGQMRELPQRHRRNAQGGGRAAAGRPQGMPAPRLRLFGEIRSQQATYTRGTVHLSPETG